jgi:hypothetical protein
VYDAAIVVRPPGSCRLPGAGPPAAEGRGRAWFRAVVTNTGDVPVAVLCDVDAYRASGHRIASQVPVPVWIVQDPGVLWLKGHQREVVRWFFDSHDAPASIGEAGRFVASCRRNPSPPT